MGLNDVFGGDDEDDNKSSSSRKYVKIKHEEFVQFLDSLPHDFVLCHDEPSHEAVFESNAVMEDYSGITLRIFSTIDDRDGISRDKGADAMRTVIWNRHIEKPVGGRTKTLRIKTWKKNLRDKIESLIDESDDYVRFCPDCEDRGVTGFLIKKSGKYGEFYGCNNYDNGCKYTEQIDD